MSDMRRTTRWKRAVKVALACIVVLDVVLLAFLWQLASSNPKGQIALRDRLAAKEKLLFADVARGQGIRTRLPQIELQCNRFSQQNLLPSSTGYSTVVGDLSRMAKDAGVTTSGVTFRQNLLKDHGLREVTISASISGNYENMAKLVDDLEHSEHFYVLDSLTLDSDSAGGIKLNMSLRTYFQI
jgi:Tfp pilus assembly protein PilO